MSLALKNTLETFLQGQLNETTFQNECLTDSKYSQSANYIPKVGK